MKTLKKIDFWMFIETMAWAMAALWGLISLVSLMFYVGEGLTQCWSWTIESLMGALVIRGYRKGLI